MPYFPLLVILMATLVTCRRDSFHLRMLLKTDTTVKIPQIMQKLYDEWKAKPDYEPTMIRSIPVQVTHVEERTLLMTAPFPSAKNSSVQNAELWMEFENEKRLLESNLATYIAYIKPTSDNCAYSMSRSAQKPNSLDHQMRLRYNITSLYIHCKDEDVKYLQLTTRLESEDSDLDLDESKMDVFIILQETVENDVMDLVDMTSQEITREAFMRLARKGSLERTRRAAGGKRQKKTGRKKRFCRLRKWEVTLADLGWDWVIAPTRFNANLCHGKCSFPLSVFMNATNHAVVQTLSNSLFGKPKSACCVAKELAPLTTLWQEANGIIIMKMQPDMIIKSCACL